MAPRPWTDDDTAQLRALHGSGSSLNGIAKEMGRSKATICKYAELEHLSFDRTKTVAATEAKVADAKARRAELSLRFLEEAHNELDQLHLPHIAYSFGGKDNDYNEHHFDRPTVEARERIMRTAGTAALRHLDLDKHDAADGAEAVKSLLAGIARQLWPDSGLTVDA